MGSMIEGRCSCGFESGTIFAGGGFNNFKEVCAAPALCMKCMQFVVENYYDKDSKCPTCQQKVTFYNDPILQAPRYELKDVRLSEVPPEHVTPQELVRDVFTWRSEEDERTFRLPDIQYL